MRHSKYLLFISMFLIASCIEEYTPEINAEDADIYVIEGRVSDQEGYHKVFVSKSSDLFNPVKIGVEGCRVQILDDADNVFEAEDKGLGEYLAYIGQEYLYQGANFKVMIYTPDGNVLESTYESLSLATEIDSAYYEVDSFYSATYQNYIPGIQFYIDYNGQGTENKLIKFEVEETWKYESEYPMAWTWDGRHLTTYDPPDYSLSVCWRTVRPNNIFTLTTKLNDDNAFLRYPLHNILNISPKLAKGYSLLVRQVVLSEEAFLYNEKLRSNIIENGGLYETQPQQIRGNLSNVTNPDERVLGYFSVAGVREMRIFYEEFNDIKLNTANFCTPIRLDLGYGVLRGLQAPVYLWLEKGAYLLKKECVDCRSLGGCLEKPDFWPN